MIHCHLFTPISQSRNGCYKSDPLNITPSNCRRLLHEPINHPPPSPSAAKATADESWYQGLTCGPVVASPNVLVSHDPVAYNDAARLACANGFMYALGTREHNRMLPSCATEERAHIGHKMSPGRLVSRPT